MKWIYACKLLHKTGDNIRHVKFAEFYFSIIRENISCINVEDICHLTYKGKLR